MSLYRKAAIAGIGATEFSKASGRSELQLSVEAVQHALADCGLTTDDVDGLTTFTMDTSSEIAVARELGMKEMRFFSRINYGGGAACATVQQAAMAVATGVADVVVCYRGFNERSESRFGQFSVAAATQVNTNGLDNAWSYPMGLGTPAATVAMQATSYMHEYGATSRDFGAVAVADRRHAATNPNAFYYQQPLTLEEHQESRWIVEPILRKLDCCQESDGGVALVVTSMDRARDLPQRPVRIDAASQGHLRDGDEMFGYYRGDLSGYEEGAFLGRQLYVASGLTPDDIDVAMIYENFTPIVFIQLEAFGFCGPGEATDFIAGGNIEVGGTIPVNPNGGLLGEAYIHGMNNILEGVRQVRGTAANQVDGAEHVLVSAGRSALVLAP